MKKKHVIYSAVILAIAADNAQAQSNVTLYGLIDSGINYVTNTQTGRNANGTLNGKSSVSMSDGGVHGMFGSRWGLKGTEELGGGLKAIFTLESGFGANNGALAQGGAMFGRQAFVGLTGRAGTVTVGRQYDITGDFLGPISPAMLAGISGCLPGDVDGLGRSRRINNTIKYVSPTYRGMSFGAMYAPGGRTGDLTGSQVWALAANYTLEDFSFAVGYFNARDPNLSAFGNNPNSPGAASNNMGSIGSPTAAQVNPIYAGYASAHTYETYSAGASYAIGHATLGLVYSHVAFSALGDLNAGPNPFGYTGTAIFNNGTATLTYLLAPDTSVGLSYTYTHGGGVAGHDGSTYHQLTAAARYFLSKRTELYALGTYQIAHGTDSLGQPAVANIELLSASSTNHQFAARAGIVHRF
ncbi:porin [Paraburkholderia sp. MPAMCS5]|uniref:porin n=1 Tax=Paraburkholderia sp. MPAMCS5 TaxID=3112563 RepID=UPI002E190FB6|nr:porin [Paraburkholderia sp. MPAMCS5]